MCFFRTLIRTIVGGLFTIIENTKIKNIIIGKQFESSENYEKFCKLAKQKNIKIFVVEGGMKISIEQEVYFDILWPDSSYKISENILNNNSVVCKLNYKKFSILFTGDIEKVSENAILSKYEHNVDKLKSTVLKVAHHGSKTSSTDEFVRAVNPSIALIGVGKDNKFGHPADVTIKKLEGIKCRIYRTDKCGEVVIKTDGTNTFLNE